jgi:hypothetical protein
MQYIISWVDPIFHDNTMKGMKCRKKMKKEEGRGRKNEE